MSASTFDTLTAARELEAAGLERNQAEAIAGAIRSGQGDLATHADIARVETQLTTFATKADLTNAIAGLERRTVGYVFAAAALVIGALKLL